MKVINEYVTTGEFGVEGRQAGDKNVVYIDESEVPEDVRNALKAAYVAQKKFLSLRPKAKKEDVSKLEAERDEAFNHLEKFLIEKNSLLPNLSRSFLIVSLMKSRKKCRKMATKSQQIFPSPIILAMKNMPELMLRN